MGDSHISNPQDVPSAPVADNAWAHEVQTQQKNHKPEKPKETPEKAYENWYKAVTTRKLSFDDTLALAESYCTKYGDPKYFHNDRELRAVKDWLREQNERPYVLIDLSKYKEARKNPSPEQIGLEIAKTLGFSETEIALYASQKGSNPPGLAFYASNGKEGDYFLREAQKDILGRVKIGEVTPGAISQLKKWLADYRESLLPNPILAYDWDKNRTTMEAIETHIAVPTLGFAGGLVGGVGDIVRGVGLPLHLVSSHTFMDSAADSLNSTAQSCDLTDLYTRAEQQDAGLALLNIYTKGVGGVLPSMVPGFVASKFVGVAGETSEVLGTISKATEMTSGTSETTAVLTTAISDTATTSNTAQKVHQITGEIVGATSAGGQVYESSLTAQARQIALQEFGDKNPSDQQISHRIQEIKEGKNIDSAVRHEIELRALGSAAIAAPIGAAYGRWLNDLSASTGPAFAPSVEESFALSARNEVTKGSIISVAQLITNEESQVLFGTKTQAEAGQAINDGMLNAVITPSLIGVSMVGIAHGNAKRVYEVEGLPETPRTLGQETQQPIIDLSEEDQNSTTKKKGRTENVERAELQKPVEQARPPRFSEEMWDVYQRMDFSSDFRPASEDYAKAFSRLHDSGTVTETVFVAKPGVKGPFLDTEGKNSFDVFSRTALTTKQQTFRVYSIDGSGTKIYIPEEHAKELDALHTKYGMQSNSYNHARPLTPEQALLALDRLPNSSYVKRVNLFDSQSPQDAWQEQIKNEPGFVSAATAGPDGVVNIFQGHSDWPTVSGNFSHEWVHEVGNTHPELEQTYGAATDLEQKLAVKHGEKFVNYRPYAEHENENMTVHVGEVGLHPDPDHLINFGNVGPLRAYVSAEILRTTLDSVPADKRSPFHDQYVARVNYLESNCREPAIAKLKEALADSDVDLRANAFNMIVGLKNPELLPLLSGIDYTKEPSGVGLRGAFAIKETIEKIPAEKRTEEHTRMLQQADKLHEDSVARRIQELGPELNDPDAFKQMIALNTLVILDSPQATREIIARGQSSELDQVFTVALRSVDQVYKDDPLARANAYKEIIEPHIERNSSQLLNAAINVNVLEDELHSVYENDGKGVNDNQTVKTALDVIDALKPKVTEAAKAHFANELSKGDVTSDLKALSRIGLIGSPEYAQLVVSTAQRSKDTSVIHLSLDVLRRMKWTDTKAQAASYKAIADKNPKTASDVMASLYNIFNPDATRAYFQIAAEHNVHMSWSDVPSMSGVGRNTEERNELWALGTKALSPTEKFAFQVWKSADWPDHYVDIDDATQLRKIVGWDRSNHPIFEDLGVKPEDPSERDRAPEGEDEHKLAPKEEKPKPEQAVPQAPDKEAEREAAKQHLQSELENWRTTHNGKPFDGTASSLLTPETVNELVAGIAPSAESWSSDPKPAKEFSEVTAKLDVERAKEKEWNEKVQLALEPERERLGIPKDRLFLSELYDKYVDSHPEIQREWNEIGERKFEPYTRKNELIEEAQNRLNTLQPFFDDFCDKHDMPRIKLIADQYQEGINGHVKSGRFDITVAPAAVLGGRSPRESVALITHEFMHTEQEYLIARMHMDAIGVGPHITTEQMQQVREMYGAQGQSIKDDFFQQVADKRNGRPLTDAEMQRARVIDASEDYWAKDESGSGAYKSVTSLDEFVQSSKGRTAEEIEQSIVSLKQSNPKEFDSLFGSGNAANMVAQVIENPPADHEVLKTKLSQAIDARAKEVYVAARQTRYDYEAMPHETEAFAMHTRVGAQMPKQNAAVASDLDGPMRRLFGFEFTLVDHMEPIETITPWESLSSQIFPN
jgi:hypothetical protein